MVAKAPRSNQESRVYSLADIRALARVVNRYDLTELEVESNGQRIRISRERNGPGSTFGTAEPSTVVPLLQQAAPPTRESTDDGTVLIASPFVGTFYRAPSPESPPFVEEGQTVKKGQILCIVEAMKLMNEIEAEVDARILQVLVRNAEPVEFNQPLFRVFPVA